jgi:hypothetical protein
MEYIWDLFLQARTTKFMEPTKQKLALSVFSTAFIFKLLSLLIFFLCLTMSFFYQNLTICLIQNIDSNV